MQRITDRRFLSKNAPRSSIFDGRAQGVSLAYIGILYNRNACASAK